MNVAGMSASRLRSSIGMVVWGTNIATMIARATAIAAIASRSRAFACRARSASSTPNVAARSSRPAVSAADAGGRTS